MKLFSLLLLVTLAGAGAQNKQAIVDAGWLARDGNNYWCSMTDGDDWHICTAADFKKLAVAPAAQPAQKPEGHVQCYVNSISVPCSAAPTQTESKPDAGGSAICTGSCMTHFPSDGTVIQPPAPILPCAPDCKVEIRTKQQKSKCPSWANPTASCTAPVHELWISGQRVGTLEER